MVAIFIIVTPPTIMYAMGYSLDWESKKIVQTGGIFLKSIPSGAQILVDGKDRGTTNQLISRLTPKNYSVTVAKPGYFLWQKKLEVAPRNVTEARNIFLIPESIKPELVEVNATTSLESLLKTDQDKQNEILAAQIASTTAGWRLKDTDVYFISKDNFELYKKNLNATDASQLSKESLPADSYRLYINDPNYILTLASNGTLYLLNRDTNLFEKIDQNVRGAVTSNDNKKGVYWTDNEIWVYYLNDILIQPYKTKGDKEFITRYAQKISQAIFYPNNEYIAFVVGDQIKITELDGRDQRNTIDFIQLMNPQISFDQNSGYFYYMSEGNIFKVKF